MAEPQPAAAPKPCCVCDAPDGKHCTKCKSRCYCSKACQLVDWKRGHKAQCKQLAAKFQDRLLEELMPKKKVKEEPPIVEDVAPADGSKARLSAVRVAKTAEVIALSDGASNWSGICANCLDLLPDGVDATFYECCCKSICTVCHVKCLQHDERCPLCRAPARRTDAEWLRWMQKHVDKGNAEAQFMLGTRYFDGAMGLQQNFKRAFQLYELAAAQSNVQAQNVLVMCYALGQGVEIDQKVAAQWYRRAAEQGSPASQYDLGMIFYNGKGVVQSHEEAVRWWRLAAAQGLPDALFSLGVCYANGDGVPQDYDAALRLYKRAAAEGHADAAEAVAELEAILNRPC